ncbi:MAG: cytochrome c3 family protein, partial [Flavobacteriales bacterium]|nr:cytochrome c3 family protein [Flavobacteriales bacterium]
VASGDAYAIKASEFSDAAMTPFDYLEDEQILAILRYAKEPPVSEESTTEVADGGTVVEETGGTDLVPVLIGVAVLLIILIGALAKAERSLSMVISEKTGEPFVERLGPLGWLNAHRGIAAVLGLVLVMVFIRWGFGALMTIGVYEGYQPTQPIAFSHKIHAGQNGINCVYCHSGAEKGKVAGIPSLNVCMNCHSYVSEGPSGTAEIAKIYEALDYDPSTRAYGDNPKPVEWVRIHNLPDLSYFNHSQHVVVGKIECQQCHGPIEEMEVVEQHSKLTMGWCVNCHRETSVQVADNEYYEDLHERTPEWHDGNPITVESIGGLDCAKCHY